MSASSLLESRIIEPPDTSKALSPRETAPLPKPELDRPRKLEIKVENLPTIMFQEVPCWLEPTLDGLRKVASLKEGWDSYGAGPISPLAIHSAIRFVSLFGLAAAIPEVYPMASGGVQLEWRSPRGSLEVELDIHSRISFFAKPQGGVPIEVEGVSFETFLIDYSPKVASIVIG
jgi:hypothetical protein